MPRFFVDSAQLRGGRATLLGADAAHAARSLRLRPGETLVVVDDRAVEHRVRIDVVSPTEVAGTVVASAPAAGEPRDPVHVLQALPQQGMDDAVAALVEAGATHIHPVICERSVVRPEDRRAATRVERWRAVAREAAGLAHRGRIPDVLPVAPLVDALGRLDPGVRILACALDAAAPTAPAATGAAALAIVIGPEGGLTPAELRLLAAAGAVAVHLGPRTHPARRAGAVAVTLALQGRGDLEVSPAARP